MVPTQVRQLFHRPGWVYEEKVDGWLTDDRWQRRIAGS
jgi:hypothetical protein